MYVFDISASLKSVQYRWHYAVWLCRHSFLHGLTKVVLNVLLLQAV